MQKNLQTPLSENERDQLQSYLEQFPTENINNIEMLDGFFTALICGPDMVVPSEYLAEIWGEQDSAFKDIDDAQVFLGLTLRHWNAISHTLHSAEVFLPILHLQETGKACGNDWANGFMKGVNLRIHSWQELFNDEENGGALIPILALHYENSSDPGLRPWKEAVSPEKREMLIVGLSAGVMKIYKYFDQHRKSLGRMEKQKMTVRHSEPKMGRNETCSCGSGKKYKHCCLQGTRH